MPPASEAALTPPSCAGRCLHLVLHIGWDWSAFIPSVNQNLSQLNSKVKWAFQLVNRISTFFPIPQHPWLPREYNQAQETVTIRAWRLCSIQAQPWGVMFADIKLTTALQSFYTWQHVSCVNLAGTGDCLWLAAVNWNDLSVSTWTENHGYCLLVIAIYQASFLICCNFVMEIRH